MLPNISAKSLFLKGHSTLPRVVPNPNTLRYAQHINNIRCYTTKGGISGHNHQNVSQYLVLGTTLNFTAIRQKEERRRKINYSNLC